MLPVPAMAGKHQAEGAGESPYGKKKASQPIKRETGGFIRPIIRATQPSRDRPRYLRMPEGARTTVTRNLENSFTSLDDGVIPIPKTEIGRAHV